MHAYAWYVWRREPRDGPSLKVRVGKSETITALSAANLPTPGRRRRRKPIRGRKTSQPAYIAFMRSTIAALAPIALHRPPCRALGQRRGDGVIGLISKGDANHLRPLDRGRVVISWRDVGAAEGHRRRRTSVVGRPRKDTIRHGEIPRLDCLPAFR